MCLPRRHGYVASYFEQGLLETARALLFSLWKSVDKTPVRCPLRSPPSAISLLFTVTSSPLLVT